MEPTPFPNPGGIPSKPDYRAQIIAAAVALFTPTPTLPTALRTDFSKVGGPLNQMQTPACVSHAMAQLMKMWWYLKTGEVVDFSPRFLHILSGLAYYNGGAAFGPDDGRDPVTVAKIAQNYGCATTATCPNDTALSNTEYFNQGALTQTAFTEALKYKIPGYVLVQANQLAVRTAIHLYGAVSILFKIGRSFWTDINGVVTWDQAAIDPVRAPKSQADIISGHELVGDGFDADLDHFLNHWSIDWAERGESDYIWNEWNGYILEALAIAEIPGNALELVQGLPPAGEFKHNFKTTITFGQTNPEVRALQIALSIDGENLYPEITGFYGTATKAAVHGFQTRYGIPDSGTAGTIVGPLTRAKLNQIFNL